MNFFFQEKLIIILKKIVKKKDKKFLGQANLPMFNRAGDSIFWASNNENLVNYDSCFYDGYFFQAFFAFILNNKSYNAFFFSFFRDNFNKKNNKVYVMSDDLRELVFLRIKSRKHLKSIAKNIKKTFKFNDYFFSKVFFISFYKFIIVSIKVFNRFYKFKTYKISHFVLTSTFFWKFYFLNFFQKNTFKKILLKKYF